MHRIAYVVPTKDRPADLAALFESLAAQTALPHQIVVVDGSDEPITAVVDRFPALPTTYVRVHPPSLAKQRNAGMAAIDPDITLAGYLDDDLVLAPDATERMLAFWQQADDDVGGASFAIANMPEGGPHWLSRLFLRNSLEPGRVLASGFGASFPGDHRTWPAQWLYGGATIWRREVVERFSYDEWFQGHGYLEDLDYSHRVAQHYRLFVVGDARTDHNQHPMDPAKYEPYGHQEIVNRVYAARNMPGTRLPALVWACLGTVVINVMKALGHRRPVELRLVRGNLRGVSDVLRGRGGSTYVTWK